MSSRKLTGLDTSFVLRLLTGEPEEQATLAVKQLDRIVAKGEKGDGFEKAIEDCECIDASS